MRILGVLLTVASVVWAVSPRFGAAGEPSDWLVPVLLPVAAGILMSFQQAMNGTASFHYGTPITATLVNFAAGGTVLLAAWLIKVALAGPGNPLPAEWWYYLGGPMGCLFIGLAALLVRSLGVLLTGLSMIGGQLIGSLVPRPRLPGAGHRRRLRHRRRNPAHPRGHRADDPSLARARGRGRRTGTPVSALRRAQLAGAGSRCR
jgi:transporter family-2 protein